MLCIYKRGIFYHFFNSISLFLNIIIINHLNSYIYNSFIYSKWSYIVISINIYP